MRPAEEDKVAELTVAFFEEWKAKHLTGDELWAARDAAVANIMQVKGASDWLADQDVRRALEDVMLYTQKILASLSQEEMRHYVKNRLLRRQKYTSIFPIYDVFEFPSGSQIGPCVTISFQELPDQAREHLEIGWSYEFQREPGYFAGKEEEFIRRRKDCAYLKVEVEACGFEKAGQKAARLTEDALAILRSLYDDPFPAPSYVTLAEDGSFHGRMQGRGGWSRYVPEMADEIQYWTDILTKPNPNDLEGRLRRAYRLHGLSKTVDRPELRFILLTVGLESLLLGKGDKDYLRQRIAEKAAFLTASDEKSRLEVYEAVKELYDKRSDFVHSGLGAIDESNVFALTKVFWDTIREIHKLIQQGYVAMEKDVDRKTVDGLVERLRFR